jgi:uncharacterized protein
MEVPSAAVSVALVAIVSALLAVTGVRRQPGLGILGALALIAVTLALRGEGLTAIGFAAPASWWAVVLGGLGLGVAIQLVSVAFVEPWAERLAGVPHDHSVLAGVRGSWRAYLLWLVVVWTFVVFLEEGIFRGFLMTEIARVIGTGPVAATVNVAFTAVVFGLAHGYQGRAGVVSTGVFGAVLGAVFVASGYNVWLVLFTHGFVNTVGIGLVAAGLDQRVRPP